MALVETPGRRISAGREITSRSAACLKISRIVGGLQRLCPVRIYIPISVATYHDIIWKISESKAQRLQETPAAFPAACGRRPLFQTVIYQRRKVCRMCPKTKRD